MPLWLFFSLLSVTFSVTYGLLAKKMLTNSDDHDPIAYASSLFLAVAGFSFISYMISGFHVSDLLALRRPDVLAILAANVFLYSLAPSFYWRALKHLPASEVSILYDITAVFILVFGIAIGTEVFSWSRLFGGLLIVFASIAVGVHTQWKNKFKVNKYFWMLLIATVLYSFAALTDNTIIVHQYFSPLFFQMLNFGVPALLILLLNPKSVFHLRKIYKPSVYKFILVNGLFFFGSFWSIYRAYAVGGVTSEVNFAIASETILTVVLASVFLKETAHIRLKIIAAVLASIGIYLLA